MEFIDKIYEAALVPERWTQVLEGMAQLSGGVAGTLVLFSDRFEPNGIATNIPQEAVRAYLSSGWRDSPSTEWVLANKPSHFVRVQDHLPQEENARDHVVVNGDLRGIGDGLTTILQMPSEELVGFGITRLAERGRFQVADFAALNGLRPHLYRAALIGARLGLMRARTIVQTLDDIELAAAVIGRRGEVLASNTLLDALTPALVPTAFGGIAIREPEKNRQFAEAVSRTGRGLGGPHYSLPIPGTEDHPPLIIHLLPIRGEAHDIFSYGHVLMTVSTIARKGPARPELLHGLFDLSPAEGRLAAHLQGGATLKEIAARTGISMPTLRTQMRAILAKTGVRRQAELMQLLAAL